jgi:hypothetical protein
MDAEKLSNPAHLLSQFSTQSTLSHKVVHPQVRDCDGWTCMHHALSLPVPSPAALAWIQAALALPAGPALGDSVRRDLASAASRGTRLERFRGEEGGVLLQGAGGATFRWLATVRCGGVVCPAGARGYYEVEVILGGFRGPRVGFCTADFTGHEGYSRFGVGDDAESWAVDGESAAKYHRGGPSDVADQRCPFGGKWRAGDVVGLACDVAGGNSVAAGGRILVSVNGDWATPFGPAFDLRPGVAGLHPALSASFGRFRVNLGDTSPFKFAPPSPDFRPMADFRGPPQPPA